MCQLCHCEHHRTAVESVTPEISQGSWRAVILFQKGTVQIPAEAPESSQIILHIWGSNYWKFYKNISNNAIFISCGLQKTRRSLDLDNTTTLIVTDLGKQQDIQWPFLSEESAKKYLCAVRV